MQVPQFNQAIKHLDQIDSQKLSELVINIKKSLESYETDYNKLGHSLHRLCEQIMKIKDVKNQPVLFYEDLICQVIRISIKHQFRVGFDALRFVFNLNSDFYKTANLDMSLNYPIGKDYPLKQYNPEVGQQCDTVKPYITSTSFCGWTRCTILQIQSNKYTICYANYTNPNTVRQKPWLAPLGSRTKDYQWRMGLSVGTLIQAFLNRVWYKSTVVEVGQQNCTKKVRVTYRRFVQDGDRKDSEGNNYFGLGISEDQWIDVLSPRIQQCGKMTDKKLCYYTFTSQQILLDDSYDIIFQQQYKQQPFYAIMRVISCKSLSLIKFINTFVSLGGIQKVMMLMDYPQYNDDIIYYMLANIGVMVTFFPRMFIKTSIFTDLYHKIQKYFQVTAKTLNPFKIDMGYFCYDVLGRRLFSLSEIYADQNQLIKKLIKQFLKMNMEKQMLALRYLNDLIAPAKKQYTLQERQNFNKFLKKQKIFQQIFNSNTHQQIISRTPTLLEYLIKKQIITLKQFQTLWKIVPPTDTRGRAMIEKLLTQISKQIPMNFVEFLIQRILLLKENQLTIDNLNLLKQLKNRKIDNNYQMKLLSFLWDLLTIKSGNIKPAIQEQIQKVFKAFVQIIKNPIVKMNLLQSISQKLQDCKRVKNQIELLKDFIKSYPEKYYKISQQQIYQSNIPLTIYDAVAFLKTKDIYKNLLKILSRSKDQGVKKDILNVISFLFSYDFGDVNEIIKFIYERLGPSLNFLQWVHRLLDRSLEFIVELLQKTNDFSVYQSLDDKSFQKIQEIILDVNNTNKNIKMVKSYNIKYTSTSTSTKTKKQQKIIGPQLPNFKNNFYVLVSPFKLIGMKFLQNLLFILKKSTVTNAVIKLIIQFISNLDQSIEQNSQAFRRQFLSEIFQQIRNIITQNKPDKKTIAKLQTYLNLFFEIFSQTEKNGSGDLQPHSQKIQGQRIKLNIQHIHNKSQEKSGLQKFAIVCNQNFSLWTLKKRVGQIIGLKPQLVDIIKYSDPMEDTNNMKSLSELVFYDKQSIKAAKKQPKSVIRSNLLNEQGSDISQKLEKVVQSLFQNYKNKQTNGLRMVEMQTLAEQRWKGSLFKQKDRLQKIFEQHDKQKKGYLCFKDLKQFFYTKSIKNQNAIWKLINLSGFKDDFSCLNTNNDFEIIPINTSTLPRRILSSPQIYDLIFQILLNHNFKQSHLNFYKLLSLLQTDDRVVKQVNTNLQKLLIEQKSIYRLCYNIEVANSQLSKQNDLYYNFWINNGLRVLQKRIQGLIEGNNKIYELDILVKNIILPGLIKIINMYVKQLLSAYKISNFVNCCRINLMEPTDFVKKVKQIKNLNEKQQLSQTGKKLISLSPEQQKLNSVYYLIQKLFHNLVKNYEAFSNQYLQKLTVQVVRLLGSIIASHQTNHTFSSVDYLYSIKSGSLNFRRSSIILIYIYLFYSSNRNPEQIQQLIIKLLQQMPKENKFQHEEYFNVLNELISRYMEINNKNNDKDQYFIKLANSLLNDLFTIIPPESRTAVTSDKVILGILAIIQTIIIKDTICKTLSTRKNQFTQNCLFAYNIQQKLSKIQITPEMLTIPQQQLHFKNYVICKTDNSRQIAYRIVARLHQVSSQEGEDFLNQYILPQIKKIGDDVRLTSSRSLGVGLKNFGSTCYMNSMLQVLNTVEPFRNSLMKCNSDHPVLKQLKNIFSALYFSERLDYAPGNLLNAFVPPINPGIQQDTTQFLNFLFDQLEVALSSSRYKKLLDQIFKGVNTSQMICHSCGYKKQNKQPFFSFGVQIQGKVDLQSALEGSYQGEVISDYLCDSCQNRGLTTKRNILSQIPSVMFIHLRRIVFNYDMFVNMKIHTRLHFPQQLNIQPYTKEGVQLRESLGLQYMKNLSHNEEQSKKFEKLAEHEKQPNFYKLKLKGVIVHSGSADVGHYYSILQNDKLWRKYDDSRVGIFTQSDFQQKCYGGTFVSDEWGSGTSANAYVLVYQKVVKNPIQILAQKQNEPQERIKYDEIKMYNSPEDYRRFWIDNHQFMVENQLLCSKNGKQFINFLCKILQKSPKCQNKVQIISQIIYRISYHSSFTGDILKILIQNVENVTPLIFYNFILSNKLKTFKLLLNQQKYLRDFMATYMQIILLQSFKKGDEKVKSDVIGYIAQILNALTGQVAKNWLRIDGYLKLLYLLVSSSISFIDIYKFFLSRNLISTLIDFVLEKQSPVKINLKNYSLGTKTNPLDFTYGIAIISFLVRHSYGFTGKNYETISIPQQFFYHLNINDVTCLSHMEFYRKMFRQRQNLYDLAIIIHRLSTQNLQFSRAICYSILEAIGSITDSKDEMLDFNFILLQILKIRDQFWTDRAQMLLGTCAPYAINQNLMTTFDEERFLFTSTIYDIFPIQCLLSYVYLYRLKNTLACFQLVKTISQACSISQIGIKFLARLPSPTYLFPNYLIWMQNFVQTFISLISFDLKQKQRIESQISHVLKNIQIIKKYMQKYPAIDFYKSVITGEIVNKKQIRSFEKQGVQFKMYEYQVYCYESKPTNIGGNLSMDQYLQSSRLTKSVTNDSNILRFFKKPGKSITLKIAPVQQDQDKQLYSLFDQKPYVPEQPKDLNIPQIQQQQKKANIPQKQVNNQKQKPNEEVQLNLKGIFTSNYFRQIQVINMSKQKKVVHLNLVTGDNSNFIIPKTFSWKIFSKNNQSLWMAKQNVDNNWGDSQIKAQVVQYVKEKHEIKNVSSWWFKTYQNIQNKIELQIKQQQTHSQNKPLQVAAAQKSTENIQNVEQVNPNILQCPVCTYHNQSILTSCQMCGSPL